MLLSVVIPLYNKERDILRTLQSVFAQTFTDYELIVVDDGSTDGSVRVVVEAAKTHPLKLIQKSNGGVCSARNAGIRAAQGEYVALLDADDTWNKDYLLEQVKMINDFSEAAMWGINYAEMHSNRLIRRLNTGLPDDYRGYVDHYFAMRNRQSDLFCSSSVVIRRRVFEQVGYFDERLRYSEDIDMWFRIIATNRVAFYDKYMVFYLYDASNRAMNRNRMLRYWLPYYPEKYQVSPYKDNREFYVWVQRWCAICIKRVYFSDKAQINDAKSAIKKLDISVLPTKYRFFFHLPYPIAAMLYRWDEKRLNKH